jgi:hypothetical protein
MMEGVRLQVRDNEVKLQKHLNLQMFRIAREGSRAPAWKKAASKVGTRWRSLKSELSPSPTTSAPWRANQLNAVENVVKITDEIMLVRRWGVPRSR